MTLPLTTQQLDEIEAVIAVYQQHPDIGFACCSAHPVADAGTALLAEVRRLQKQRKYLIDQLAKRDAETGRGDEALREFLADEDAAEEQPAEADTLAEWLHWRFGPHGQPWVDVADDHTYWEHQARAVRRAVDRGGFKTQPPAAAGTADSRPA